MVRDIKDMMIEAVERERTTEAGAYEYVLDSLASAADEWRTRAKEHGWRNPLVADYFCTTCHWSENAHPKVECPTGFIPGDPEVVRAANARLGF